ILLVILFLILVFILLLLSARQTSETSTRAPDQRKTARLAGSTQAPGRQQGRGARGRGRPRCRSRIGTLLFDERLNPLRQQGNIKRLLEGFAEAEIDQPLGSRFVLAGEGDDQGLLVLRVAAEVGGNLQGFAAAHGEI